MHRSWPAAVLAAAPLALCCIPAEADAQGRSAATARAVDQAIRGLGGRRAVASLRSFRVQARGRTWIFDEGPNADDAVTPASTFSTTVTYDRARSGERLRADSVRTSLGTARRVTEVISGRLGAIAGVDANGAPAADRAMPSDRRAAILREHRLLNPQLIVRAVLARPRLASTLPATRIRGRLHRVLVVGDDVAPIRLYVDARTGRIDRLSTQDHNAVRRDVRVVVDYAGWRAASGAPAGRRVRFPRTVTLRVAGTTLHTETRTTVALTRPPNRALFRFPAGVAPTFDAALARRGARTTEWLMSFAHLGFPKDGSAGRVVPRPIAPGSTLIQGIANNSMVVEQQAGIVVVEGALDDARAEALLRYVGTTFPGKPVRFVTASHHHADHAGGMRPFVALGATAVIHEAAVPLFRRVFGDRSSRLLPDRLDRTTAPVTIRTVPATGRVTLTDPLRPVIVLPERTSHATTTILVFIPDQGVLFVNGDTYTPGGAVGPAAASLEQTIRGNGLNVRWIVGGHGGIVSYADFRAALGQPLEP